MAKATTIETLRALESAASEKPAPTQRELGLRFGLGRTRIANLQRVLRLPPLILGWVWAGRLSPKHAEAVAGLESAQAESLARAAIAGRWSAQRLRIAIQDLREGRGGERRDANVEQLAQALSELCATQVRIEHRPDGSGSLVLRYTDLETLDGLLERLGYRPE